MAGLSPYQNPYSVAKSKEVDLRKSIKNLLYGSVEEEPKGRRGLIRKMRRDEDRNLIRCACVDELTDQHTMDKSCRYCFGHGYYWDEVPFVYFKNDKQYRNKEENISAEYVGNIFYCEYNNQITNDDYIVELSLDIEGSVIIPIRREKFYRVLSVITERSDHGRIEFIAIRTVEERKWSTWNGVKNRQY